MHSNKIKTLIKILVMLRQRLIEEYFLNYTKKGQGTIKVTIIASLLMNFSIDACAVVQLDRKIVVK